MDVSQCASDRIRRRDADAVLSAMFVALLLIFAVALPARAQNLVQDPNFSAGLTYYQSPYGYSSTGATATIYNNMTGVELYGSSGGFIEQYPIVGYTSGVNYVFTFLVAATSPTEPTTIYAGFGPTCTGDCENANLTQTTSSSALTPFSFSGTSTNSSGSEFFIEAAGGNAFVTGLDFEAAPAPVPGAGMLSFGVLLVGLAFRKISLRRAG